MKNLSFLVIFFISICFSSSCKDDNYETEESLLKIENTEFLFFRNHTDAIYNSKGNHYIYVDGNSLFIYYTKGKDYKGQQYLGKMYNYPKEILNKNIPTTGITLSISGEFKKSKNIYSYIPEVVSVEFYTSTLTSK